MGTHLRALSESYPMNTNMAWFKWFWRKVASALEGLKSQSLIETGLDIADAAYTLK